MRRNLSLRIIANARINGRGLIFGILSNHRRTEDCAITQASKPASLA
jgi:hypothetical protein